MCSVLKSVKDGATFTIRQIELAGSIDSDEESDDP